MRTLVQSPKALGRALRDARKRQDLTQQKLADMTGVGQPTVSNVENGVTRVSVDTILRLSAALNLELILQSRPDSDPAAVWQD